MSDLFVGVSYNLPSNQFTIKTNAKDPRKIIAEFLRTQIGAGKDESPVNDTVSETFSYPLTLISLDPTNRSKVKLNHPEGLELLYTKIFSSVATGFSNLGSISIL